MSIIVPTIQIESILIYKHIFRISGYGIKNKTYILNNDLLLLVISIILYQCCYDELF